MSKLTDEQQKAVLAVNGALGAGTMRDVRSARDEAIRLGVDPVDIHEMSQTALSQFSGLSRPNVDIVLLFR